jgi:hypothetical protein
MASDSLNCVAGRHSNCSTAVPPIPSMCQTPFCSFLFLSVKNGHQQLWDKLE